MNYNKLSKFIATLWIMVPALSLNAAHENTDFAALRKKVKHTQKKSYKDDVSDFNEWPLSCLTYQEALKQYFPPGQPDVPAIVDSIWSGCNYTAPIALAWLAPEQSYKNQEQAYHAVAKYGFLNKVLPNNTLIQIGMDNFERNIKSIVSDEDSVIFLCNLFYQNHVFLVQKIGQKFRIIQSYAGHYSFVEFLSDSEKHRWWSADQIIFKLGQLLSKEADIKDRITCYQELFFVNISEDQLKRCDANNFLRFVFIATKTFKHSF